MIENSFVLNFEKQILGVFENQKLRGLSDFEEYLKIQAEMIEKYREKYFRIENKPTEKEIKKQNDSLMLLLSDIKNCNSDLKLFTANLYLLRPSINNPTKEKKIIGENHCFTYYQNFSDWNYSAFVSCCYEKLYNYWDRIGDVIALHMNLDIKEHQITFAFVIDYLNKKNNLKNDEDFMFLKLFKENQFIEFNNIRKKVVHYNQFETIYKYEFDKTKHDDEKVKKLWGWKENMPEYFKNHLELSIKGYVHCFKFINTHF